jgi:hypothetical protein
VRKGPYQCRPLANISRDPATGTLVATPGDEVAAYVANGTWRNIIAGEVLGQASMPMVPIYNVTVPAWNRHRSNGLGPECSHYCYPGVPQQWVAILHQALATHGVKPLPAGYQRHIVEPLASQRVFEWSETDVEAAAARQAVASGGSVVSRT